MPMALSRLSVVRCLSDLSAFCSNFAHTESYLLTAALLGVGVAAVAYKRRLPPIKPKPP